MADSFSYKITSESELFTFDFSQVLGPSETITTATCVAVVMNGTDANPSNIIVGSTVIVNQTASQRIANGVSEVTYRLEMTITTSQGNTYVGVGDLTVYDATLV